MSDRKQIACHRKTCHRFNDVGHAHALTFSCFRRQPFLSKDRSRQWLAAAVNQGCQKSGFDVWAYVIMPEHVHLLVWPSQIEYNISDLLRCIKLSVSKRALSFVRANAPEFLRQMEDRQPNGVVSYRFWQRGGGYDRNLTEPKTIGWQIDYLHNNPVRRGLCVQPEDWYWSSAADHARIRVGPITVNRTSLPWMTEFVK